MLFESNRDNEDNNDCTSISSKESIDSRKARRGSLVKEIIDKSNAVGISLDLEHGGDKCGVTQLSAVLFRLGGVEDSALSKDVMIREVLTSMSGHHSLQNGTLYAEKRQDYTHTTPKSFKPILLKRFGVDSRTI